MDIKKTILPFLLTLIFFSPLWAQEADFRVKYAGLDSLLNEKSFFGNHLTGFILFEPDSQRVIYEKNSHINFLPASTTKLLTFYGSIMILKDSLPAFRYLEIGKQITIWGTGYPGWKYSKLPQQGIDEFLGKFDTINFSDQNWKEESFGYGWQWDDFNYSYSAEKSPFPIFGNIVTFTNNKRVPLSNIPYFGKVAINLEKTNKGVERDRYVNSFYFNPNNYTESKSEIPFITSPELFRVLVKETLKKNVNTVKHPIPSSHKVFYGGKIRPLWIEILQESDNFIAEQLLLMMSDKQFLELNSERVIEYIQKTYFRDLPDQPKWVDGSGLSRHNLITPRSMISILVKIEKEIPRSQVMQLLPQGGISGTLKNNYKARSPYIFAKSGTVANNHSLVGYIKSDTGKIYAFAFMNNNYLNKAPEVRREMEKVMLYIKESF
ncbi:D-alanyl-D-alanine carboxypeptidase [Aquiflexum sp. TKW24L]|uniref:D-alanyl-D-alanine carboxypeptidase n=1 Tax=Aquiflexum sp. TKW24L TaxID=2942212 RepID=UPI0020C0E59B|nr:D-alanyl-D-alanine carboxypeptidase [Aquiflexum sp. TKW24L]MCL6259940.1 D-alanyl-D-alanine carboxypeptidase [Aquiflexum sp. TKW24L]